MIVSSDHYNFCAKYSQLSSVPSSPERRFKTISPCRRLFEDHSTNQSGPSQYGFVVSNGNLATPNFNNNNNGNNCNLASFDTSSEFSEPLYNVTKQQSNLDTAILTVVAAAPNTTTTIASRATFNCTGTSSEELKAFEGLSEILKKSYNRRGSISQQVNPSSPFMDDLGFLSSSSSFNNTAYSTSMNNNNENSDTFDSEMTRMTLKSKQEMFLSSSPTTTTKNANNSPMSCFIRKSSSMHWNRRVTPVCNKKIIQPRRSMSEGPQILIPQISDNGLIHHLPCFDSPNDAIKRISPDILIDVLDGKYDELYRKIFIIDCRYPYEFEGGHIPSAINVNSPEVIESLLMQQQAHEDRSNSLIVFHCEFSSERAPRMALHVRNLDRQLNKTAYPALFYPEMYILDGGYKNYWQQHGMRCEPPHAYLPMRNPKFRDQLRHHQKMKHAFRSGCHLSQHSMIKSQPPKSASRPRSRSLNVANARKFFNDLISSNSTSNNNNNNIHEEDNSEDQDVSFTSTDKHMFPSYSIPMANSFSSIFASELDIPSEMDIDVD